MKNTGPAPDVADRVEIDDPLLLERFLPYRLNVLSNRISQALAGLYQARFGLTIPQWRVMAILGRHPGISAGEVAQRAAMDKVKVHRAVTGLLADGRIERATAVDDRRRSILRLSAAGRQTYGEIVPVARAYEDALLKDFDAAAIEAMDALIGRLDAAAAGVARMPSAPPPDTD